MLYKIYKLKENKRFPFTVISVIGTDIVFVLIYFIPIVDPINNSLIDFQFL